MRYADAMRMTDEGMMTPQAQTQTWLILRHCFITKLPQHQLPDCRLLPSALSSKFAEGPAPLLRSSSRSTSLSSDRSPPAS